MKKPANFINQAFIVTFIIVGVVAVSAVVFQYSNTLERFN